MTALIKNSASPPEIRAMLGLIRHRIRDLSDTPVSERVRAKSDISDFQKRKRTDWGQTKWTGPFTNIRFISAIVTKEINEISQGSRLVGPCHLSGRRAWAIYQYVRSKSGTDYNPGGWVPPPTYEINRR